MSDEPVFELGRPFLRPGTRDDAPGIRSLLAEVFSSNPKCDPAIMDWQYWNNPYGEARIWLWEKDGRIVCHIATLRVPVQLGGRSETAGMVVDAATLPAYRRMGLFTAMRPAQREEMVGLGVRLTLNYNRPTPTVPRGSLVPASYEARMSKYIVPLDDRWIAERLRVPRALVRAASALLTRPKPSRFVADEIDSPPVDVGFLWSEVCGGLRLPNGIRREGSWWSWRYGEHPRSIYRFFEVRSAGRIRGAAVTREKDAPGGHFTYLMELLTLDRDAARAVVRAAVIAAEGSLGLVFLAIPGTRSASLARASGMRPIPRVLEDDPLTFVVREYVSSRAEVRGQWTAAFGDVDFL